MLMYTHDIQKGFSAYYALWQTWQVNAVKELREFRKLQMEPQTNTQKTCWYLRNKVIWKCNGLTPLGHFATSIIAWNEQNIMATW